MRNDAGEEREGRERAESLKGGGITYNRNLSVALSVQGSLSNRNFHRRK